MGIMLLLLLLAISHAKVHPFRAESAWICNVCTEALHYVDAFTPFLLQGAPMDPTEKIQSLCLTTAGTKFSTACDSFIDQMEQVYLLKSMKKSSTDVCIAINMCEETEVVSKEHRFTVNN